MKREIQDLKEKLGRTGKEPKNKRQKLIEVCEDIYRENYFEWYMEKKTKREREERIGY